MEGEGLGKREVNLLLYRVVLSPEMVLKARYFRDCDSVYCNMVPFCTI